MKKYYAIRQLLLPLFILLLLHCQGANAQGIYPDPSFGNNGLRVFPQISPTGNTQVRYLSAKDGNTFFIYRSNYSQYGIEVMKYFPTGLLDSSFGTNGTVSPLWRHEFKDATLDSSGRVVVAGSRQGLGGRDDLDVFRITTGGAIDTGFNFSGGWSSQFLYSYDRVQSLVTLNDGVAITSQHTYFNPPMYNLVSYGFTILGSSGRVNFEKTNDSIGYGVSVLGNRFLLYEAGQLTALTELGITDSSFDIDAARNFGRLKACGGKLYSLSADSIHRYNLDSTRDLSFNGTGSLLITATDIASYQDKIIVAGSSSISLLNNDGRLDSSFGNNGTVLTGNLDRLYRLHLDGNRLYVFGYFKTPNSTNANLAIAAYIFAATTTFKCPESRRVMVDAGQCNAIVYGIDPLLNNGITMSRMKFRLQGATAAFGTGTASGQSFNAGTTRVSYIIDNNEASECSFEVLVLDAQPPSITNAYAWPPVLWPPNHTLRKVDINYLLHDNCGAVSSLSVTSDEPAGNNDWQIKDSHTLYLRATRNGNGQGRKYTITIHAIDKAGNTTAKNVWVVVPQHLIGKFDKIKPLSVTATPNPSSDYFNIATQSSSEKPVTIKISDIQGRVVMVKANLPANTVVQIGAGLARGIYLAECTQGNERVVLKLIKLG